MVTKGVTADDSKSLRFLDCILVKNVSPKTICRARIAKYLKRTEKFLQLNLNRLSYECAMDNSSEELFLF